MNQEELKKKYFPQDLEEARMEGCQAAQRIDAMAKDFLKKEKPVSKCECGHTIECHTPSNSGVVLGHECNEHQCPCKSFTPSIPQPEKACEDCKENGQWFCDVHGRKAWPRVSKKEEKEFETPEWRDRFEEEFGGGLNHIMTFIANLIEEAEARGRQQNRDAFTNRWIEEAEQRGYKWGFLEGKHSGYEEGAYDVANDGLHGALDKAKTEERTRLLTELKEKIGDMWSGNNLHYIGEPSGACKECGKNEALTEIKNFLTSLDHE